MRTFFHVYLVRYVGSCAKAFCCQTSLKHKKFTCTHKEFTCRELFSNHQCKSFLKTEYAFFPVDCFRYRQDSPSISSTYYLALFSVTFSQSRFLNFPFHMFSNFKRSPKHATPFISCFTRLRPLSFLPTISLDSFSRAIRLARKCHDEHARTIRVVIWKREIS